MSVETIEISLAFAFVCSHCGKENFVRGVLHEFTGDEKAEYAAEIGERPETGQWITHPEHVTCNGCGADFRAVNPGELVDERTEE